MQVKRRRRTWQEQCKAPRLAVIRTHRSLTPRCGPQVEYPHSTSANVCPSHWSGSLSIFVLYVNSMSVKLTTYLVRLIHLSQYIASLLEARLDTPSSNTRPSTNGFERARYALSGGEPRKVPRQALRSVPPQGWCRPIVQASLGARS